MLSLIRLNSYHDRVSNVDRALYREYRKYLERKREEWYGDTAQVWIRFYM